MESPTGPVRVAFASRELAAVIVAFLGAAAGVFLLPDTQLTPDLVGSLPRHPVLVYRTYADYKGATTNAPYFQWAQHTIDFDFAAALGRGGA
jgi:hypothetical protein